MERFVRVWTDLISDDNFLAFQDEIICKSYYELFKGYESNENEVSIVKRLIDATNKKSYGPIKIFSKKIHGSSSLVEFNCRANKTVKELGDMLVISVVTENRKRLFQRVCIIQNKKDKNERWEIDQEQLYLLKNFPKFSGKQGLFKNFINTIFKNNSGSLGAFGLFENPGEMIFLTANVLTDMLKGKKYLARTDIGMYGKENFLNRNIFLYPFWYSPRWDEFFYYWFKYLRRYNLSIDYGNLPLFGNTFFTLDLNDFVKSWTLFNIGEYTCFLGDVINKRVDVFSNSILRAIGLRDFIDLPITNQEVEFTFESEAAIFVIHIDIGQG